MSEAAIAGDAGVESTGSEESTATEDAYTSSDSDESSPSSETESTESDTSEGDESSDGSVAEELAAKAKAKRKVKIDDEEIEVDDDELVRGYQKAQSSDKRYKEAKALHDEAMEFAKALRANPLKVLRESGLYKDNSQLADAVLEFLRAEEAQENMSPEDKALTQKEQEIARREEALREKEREAHYAEYQRAIPEALTAAGLPVNTRTAAAICHVVDAQLSNDPDAKPDFAAAAKEVRGYFKKLIPSIVEGLSDDDLFEFLSDALVDRANKVRATRGKGKKAAAAPAAAPISKEEDLEETRLIREHLKRL